MEEALYQVVITGNPTASASLQVAVRSFAVIFSIPVEDAQARFETAPCVARGMLSLEQAEKYCRVMRKQGIQCELQREQPAPPAVGIYPRLSSS